MNEQNYSGIRKAKLKMTDKGLDGAVYDGTDGSIGSILERLGDGGMSFAHLSASANAADVTQAASAKRVFAENNAATDQQSLQKRTKLCADEQWNGMLERLLAFRDRFGHCNVPKRYMDDPQLYVCSSIFVFT